MGGISNKVKYFLKKKSKEKIYESSSLYVFILDQGYMTYRLKSEFYLKNTLEEFHICDTFICDLFAIGDHFLKGGFFIEEPRANMALPIWGIAYILAYLI